MTVNSVGLKVVTDQPIETRLLSYRGRSLKGKRITFMTRSGLSRDSTRPSSDRLGVIAVQSREGLLSLLCE